MARIRLLLIAAALAALLVLAGCTASSGGGAPASTPPQSSGPTSTAIATTTTTTTVHPSSASSSRSTTATSPTATTQSPHVSLAGVRVADLSFVGTEQGWALGTNATLAGTIDGGRSWHEIATLPRPVQHIRFASARIGYAFSPGNADGGLLYLTTNGGTSWHKQPGGADALEILNGTVIRVVDGGGCPPGCTYRVELSTPGSATWHSQPLPSQGLGDNVTLARTGHDAYLAEYGNPAGGASSEQTTLDISHDDGRTWTKRAAPCPFASGHKEVDLTFLTAAPDGSAVGLCSPRGHLGSAYVVVSTDRGKTFRVASKNALGAASVSLVGAASATDVLMMSDQLYRSTDGGSRFGKVVGPASARFIGFETTSVGRVLSARNTVWTTRDGGSTWISQHVR